MLKRFEFLLGGNGILHLTLQYQLSVLNGMVTELLTQVHDYQNPGNLAFIDGMVFTLRVHIGIMVSMTNHVSDLYRQMEVLKCCFYE